MSDMDEETARQLLADPAKAEEIVRDLQRRTALMTAKKDALGKLQEVVTPLAAWRDTAAGLPSTVSSKPLFNRLLAAGGPRVPVAVKVSVVGRKEGKGGEDTSSETSPPHPGGYPHYSFAGFTLGEMEMRLISSSLKASLTIPVYRAHLLSLDLSCCGIGVEGAEQLARGLAGNHGLERLNLRDNPLTVEGGELILRGLLANFRWLGSGAQYDRFGRPLDQGSSREAPHDITQQCILDGTVVEDDFDGRGCTLATLKKRSLLRLKQQFEEEVARRGGYSSRRLTALPSDAELADGERAARDPSSWVIPREVGFAKALALDIGGGSGGGYTSKAAKDVMESIAVEGLSGVEPLTGMVLGGDAMKEVLWGRTQASKAEAERLGKGVKKRRPARAATKKASSPSLTKITQSLAKAAAGGGGESVGGGGKKTPTSSRSPSPSKRRRVGGGRRARVAAEADQMIAAQVADDRDRDRIARQLGIGVHARTVKVEPGDEVNGRSVWIGDKMVSERVLTLLARRWGVSRQVVAGYKIQLPAEVSGTSSAVTAARNARLKKERKLRITADAEVGEDKDSEEEAEKALDDLDGRIEVLKRQAQRARETDDPGKAAVLRALEAAQAAHDGDNASASGTDTSEGAESPTEAAHRQPYAPLDYLLGTPGEIPVYAPFNYAPLGGEAVGLGTVGAKVADVSGRLSAGMGWQPPKRDPSGKLLPGKILELSGWGLNVTPFPGEDHLMGLRSVGEREEAIAMALKAIPGWLGRVKPTNPVELRRFQERLGLMDVQESKAFLDKLLPGAGELARMTSGERVRVLGKAARGFDGTLGGATFETRHASYTSRVKGSYSRQVEYERRLNEESIALGGRPKPKANPLLAGLQGLGLIGEEIKSEKGGRAVEEDESDDSGNEGGDEGGGGGEGRKCDEQVRDVSPQNTILQLSDTKELEGGAKAPQPDGQTPAPELTLEEMEAQMLESKAAFEKEVAEADQVAFEAEKVDKVDLGVFEAGGKASVWLSPLTLPHPSKVATGGGNVAPVPAVAVSTPSLLLPSGEKPKVARGGMGGEEDDTASVTGSVASGGWQSSVRGSVLGKSGDLERKRKRKAVREARSCIFHIMAPTMASFVDPRVEFWSGAREEQEEAREAQAMLRRHHPFLTLAECREIGGQGRKAAEEAVLAASAKETWKALVAIEAAAREGGVANPFPHGLASIPPPSSAGIARVSQANKVDNVGGEGGASTAYQRALIEASKNSQLLMARARNTARVLDTDPVLGLPNPPNAALVLGSGEGSEGGATSAPNDPPGKKTQVAFQTGPLESVTEGALSVPSTLPSLCLPSLALHKGYPPIPPSSRLRTPDETILHLAYTAENHARRYETAPDGRIGIASVFPVARNSGTGGVPLKSSLKYLCLANTFLTVHDPAEAAPAEFKSAGRVGAKDGPPRAGVGKDPMMPPRLVGGALDALAALLSHPNCALEEVDLSKNRVTSALAEPIVAALDANTSLKSINLHSTGCGPVLGVALVARGLTLTRAHGRSVLCNPRYGMEEFKSDNIVPGDQAARILLETAVMGRPVPPTKVSGDDCNNAMEWSPAVTNALISPTRKLFRPWVLFTLVQHLPPHFIQPLSEEIAEAIIRTQQKGGSGGILSVVSSTASTSAPMSYLVKASPPPPPPTTHRPPILSSLAGGRRGDPPRIGEHTFVFSRLGGGGAAWLPAEDESEPELARALKDLKHWSGKANKSKKSKGPGATASSSSSSLDSTPSSSRPSSPSRPASSRVKPTGNSESLGAKKLKKVKELEGARASRRADLLALEEAFAASGGSLGAISWAERGRVGDGLHTVSLNGCEVGDLGALAIGVTLMAGERAIEGESGRLRSKLRATLAASADPLNRTPLHPVDDRAAVLSIPSASQRLHTLDLRVNDISALGLRHLARGLRLTTCLKKLDLSHNPLGCAGAHVIASLLGGGAGGSASHSPLSTLILDHTLLTDRGKDFSGILALLDSLKYNRYLETLSLRYNTLVVQSQGLLGVRRVQQVAFAIQDVFSHNTTLRCVDVSDNVLGPSGERILKGALAQFPYAVPNASVVVHILTQWMDRLLLKLHGRQGFHTGRGGGAAPKLMAMGPLSIRKTAALRETPGVLLTTADTADTFPLTSSGLAKDSMVSISDTPIPQGLAPLHYPRHTRFSGVPHRLPPGLSSPIPNLPPSLAIRVAPVEDRLAKEIAESVMGALGNAACDTPIDAFSDATVTRAMHLKDKGGVTFPQPVGAATTIRAATVLDYLFPAATGVTPPISALESAQVEFEQVAPLRPLKDGQLSVIQSSTEHRLVESLLHDMYPPPRTKYHTAPFGPPPPIPRPSSAASEIPDTLYPTLAPLVAPGEGTSRRALTRAALLVALATGQAGEGKGPLAESMYKAINGGYSSAFLKATAISDTVQRERSERGGMWGGVNELRLGEKSLDEITEEDGCILDDSPSNLRRTSVYNSHGELLGFSTEAFAPVAFSSIDPSPQIEVGTASDKGWRERTSSSSSSSLGPINERSRRDTFAAADPRDSFNSIDGENLGRVKREGGEGAFVLRSLAQDQIGSNRANDDFTIPAQGAISGGEGRLSGETDPPPPLPSSLNLPALHLGGLGGEEQEAFVPQQPLDTNGFNSPPLSSTVFASPLLSTPKLSHVSRQSSPLLPFPPVPTETPGVHESVDPNTVVAVSNLLAHTKSGKGTVASALAFLSLTEPLEWHERGLSGQPAVTLLSPLGDKGVSEDDVTMKVTKHPRSRNGGSPKVKGEETSQQALLHNEGSLYEFSFMSDLVDMSQGGEGGSQSVSSPPQSTRNSSSSLTSGSPSILPSTLSSSTSPSSSVIRERGPPPNFSLLVNASLPHSVQGSSQTPIAPTSKALKRRHLEERSKYLPKGHPELKALEELKSASFIDRRKRRELKGELGYLNGSSVDSFPSVVLEKGALVGDKEVDGSGSTARDHTPPFMDTTAGPTPLSFSLPLPSPPMYPLSPSLGLFAKNSNASTSGLPLPYPVLAGTALGSLGVKMPAFAALRKLEYAAMVEAERWALYSGGSPWWWGSVGEEEEGKAMLERTPLPTVLRQDYIVIAGSPSVGEVAIPRLDLSRLLKHPPINWEERRKVEKGAGTAGLHAIAALESETGTSGNVKALPGLRVGSPLSSSVILPPQPLTVPRSYLVGVLPGPGGYAGISSSSVFYNVRGRGLDDIAEGLHLFKNKGGMARGDENPVGSGPLKTSVEPPLTSLPRSLSAPSRRLGQLPLSKTGGSTSSEEVQVVNKFGRRYSEPHVVSANALFPKKPSSQHLDRVLKESKRPLSKLETKALLSLDVHDSVLTPALQLALDMKSNPTFLSPPLPPHPTREPFLDAARNAAMNYHLVADMDRAVKEASCAAGTCGFLTLPLFTSRGGENVSPTSPFLELVDKGQGEKDTTSPTRGVSLSTPFGFTSASFPASLEGGNRKEANLSRPPGLTSSAVFALQQLAMSPLLTNHGTLAGAEALSMRVFLDEAEHGKMLEVEALKHLRNDIAAKGKRIRAAQERHPAHHKKNGVAKALGPSSLALDAVRVAAESNASGMVLVTTTGAQSSTTILGAASGGTGWSYVTPGGDILAPTTALSTLPSISMDGEGGEFIPSSSPPLSSNEEGDFFSDGSETGLEGQSRFAKETPLPTLPDPPLLSSILPTVPPVLLPSTLAVAALTALGHDGSSIQAGIDASLEKEWGEKREKGLQEERKKRRAAGKSQRRKGPGEELNIPSYRVLSVPSLDYYGTKDGFRSGSVLTSHATPPPSELHRASERSLSPGGPLHEPSLELNADPYHESSYNPCPAPPAFSTASLASAGVGAILSSEASWRPSMGGRKKLSSSLSSQERLIDLGMASQFSVIEGGGEGRRGTLLDSVSSVHTTTAPSSIAPLQVLGSSILNPGAGPVSLAKAEGDLISAHLKGPLASLGMGSVVAPLPPRLNASSSPRGRAKVDPSGGVQLSEPSQVVSQILSAGPTPTSISLTVSQLSSTLISPPSATLPGPGGKGVLLKQEQTGGLHDKVTAPVFSTATLRGEVLKRVMEFLGVRREIILD